MLRSTLLGFAIYVLATNASTLSQDFYTSDELPACCFPNEWSATLVARNGKDMLQVAVNYGLKKSLLFTSLRTFTLDSDGGQSSDFLFSGERNRCIRNTESLKKSRFNLQFERMQCLNDLMPVVEGKYYGWSGKEVNLLQQRTQYKKGSEPKEDIIMSILKKKLLLKNNDGECELLGLSMEAQYTHELTGKVDKFVEDYTVVSSKPLSDDIPYKPAWNAQCLI